jgi:uncharacterized membrane protein YidH (DUF202 family)
MNNKEKNKHTSNELAEKRTLLAEERTLLSFIRTVAIFCGIFVLLKKENNKYIFPNILLFSLILLLSYRLYNIKYTAHKNYIRILGSCLIICMIILIFIK